ncbi:MAG: GNAT family N-acetyltransferase [Gemmatimonadota bacterium]|nr:MAG: GNAT family N-acetyltransferase [Gemmatimonadota bacterium]
MSPRAAAARVKLEFRPLTPDRWSDLKRLFGSQGACGGCWCMWWRLSHSAFEKRKGERNRRAFKRIVDSGAQPGLLAYIDDAPVAWCAIQPRDAFPRLEGSRTLKRVDDEPVWSVACLFVAKGHRRTGVSSRLLEAAVKHARRQGAKIVEGYPVEPKKGRTADAFAWTGTASAFRKAGFTEVARRSETRPIMRCELRRLR